ncbi:MAG TPA: nickel-binding protein [Candidatus Limnocylindrales bacterium]|nr:nickel-binding protein [Candidatus Limnocylindrales bacterium]
MDRDHVSSAPTRTFLVERYWPGVDEAIAQRVVASLERAARSMTAEGTPVAHVGSILMPADEVVFSLIEAADEQAARQVNERADVPLDRIAAAITLNLQSR